MSMKKSQSIRRNNIYFHHSISTHTTEKFALHCHNFYEVYFFITGNARYLVEGIEYRPEPYSMLLIAPNVFHGVSIQSEHPYERYSAHFLPEALHENNRETLLTPFHQATIYYNQIDDFHISNYFEMLLACRDMEPRLQKLAMQARLESMLAQVVHLQKSSENSPRIRSKTSYSPHRLVIYINNHLQEPLSLSQLSGLFYIGKNQLNHTFRQATGTTINRYINQKRATLARQYILEGMSPSSACVQAGFQDYSNFFRTYKKIHGYSPAETKSASIWADRN